MIELTTERDSWVLVEAGSRLDESSSDPLNIFDEKWYVYRLLAPGHVPVGFTNPVRLDSDGDGFWTPSIDQHRD